MPRGWFRLHCGYTDHFKITQLDDAEFRWWHRFLDMGSQWNPRGSLPPVERIGRILNVRPARIHKWLIRLLNHKLVDQLPTPEKSRYPAYKLHDWDIWQYVGDNKPTKISEFEHRAGPIQTYQINESVPLGTPKDLSPIPDVPKTYLKRTPEVQNFAESKELPVTHITDIQISASSKPSLSQPDLFDMCFSDNSGESGDNGGDPRSEERYSELKRYFEVQFQNARGHKMITDKADWVQFARMLKRTSDWPVERVQAAWVRYIYSKDDFDLKQGHPLRWFCSNIQGYVHDREQKAKSYKRDLVGLDPTYYPEGY